MLLLATDSCVVCVFLWKPAWLACIALNCCSFMLWLFSLHTSQLIRVCIKCRPNLGLSMGQKKICNIFESGAAVCFSWLGISQAAHKHLANVWIFATEVKQVENGDGQFSGVRIIPSREHAEGLKPMMRRDAVMHFYTTGYILSLSTHLPLVLNLPTMA